MIHTVASGDITKFDLISSLPVDIVYKWHYLNRINAINACYAQLDHFSHE